MGELDLWLNKLEQWTVLPELPLADIPCLDSCGEVDCAVVAGMYSYFSDSLAEQPIDIQIAVAKKWTCHNDPTKACKGNADNLGLSW